MPRDLELKFLVLVLGAWYLADINALDGHHHIHVDPSLPTVVNDFELPLI